MDVVGLADATDIRPVGHPGPQSLDGGVFVPKSGQKVVGEVFSVEGLFAQSGDGFFDFNCMLIFTQTRAGFFTEK